MILKNEFNILIKTMLTVFLVVMSMLAYAQTSVTEVETNRQAPASATPLSATDNQQHSFNFPRWPEQRHVYRDRIPLAPPGPYMSSALSEFSFDRTTFENGKGDTGKSQPLKPPAMHMQRFNPGIPWPSNARSHDSGYALPPATQPERGPNDETAATGDRKLSDGNRQDRKWQDRKWPDWPDSYESKNSWPEDKRKIDDWPQEWTKKWPHVTRHEDEWTSNRRTDDKWPDDKWPDDNWSNSTWPEDKWPDSRRSDNKWPDDRQWPDRQWPDRQWPDHQPARQSGQPDPVNPAH